MNKNMDGNSPDGGEGGQKPHGVLGRKPEYVLAFADHNKSLKRKIFGTFFERYLLAFF